MFERCPICQKVKRIAAQCAVCGVIAIAALDPHAHTHGDKYVPQPTRTVTVVASTTASLNLGNEIFKVVDWPPKST
jgi:hypothetical protein